MWKGYFSLDFNMHSQARAFPCSQRPCWERINKKDIKKTLQHLSFIKSLYIMITIIINIKRILNV